MMTKKVRTEYMKKFREPKWEAFSKCYEDSLKYRLTRRVMEHSHKPWIYEGWECSSESSGWSTPRLTRSKVVPFSVARPQTALDTKHQRLKEFKPPLEPKRPLENGESETEASDTSVSDATSKAGSVIENGVNESDPASVKVRGRASDDLGTDDGPVGHHTSDEEPTPPKPRRRHRLGPQRAKQGQPDGKPGPSRKPLRAKSQPPFSSKEKEGRLDWTDRRPEVRRSTPEGHATNTRREPDKRNSNQERRRARSADLEKTRKSQLSVADDHWVTEYMRCFSARLR